MVWYSHVTSVQNRITVYRRLETLFPLPAKGDHQTETKSIVSTQRSICAKSDLDYKVRVPKGPEEVDYSSEAYCISNDSTENQTEVWF